MTKRKEKSVWRKTFALYKSPGEVRSVVQENQQVTISVRTANNVALSSAIVLCVLDGEPQLWGFNPQPDNPAQTQRG